MNRKLEFILGLFVICIVSIIILGLFNGFLLNSNKSTKDVYYVDAVFSHLQGIEKHSKIKLSGMDIGYVVGFDLSPKDYSVVVHLAIYNDFNQIPIDSMFSIKQTGIIGEYYIEVKPGIEQTEFVQDQRMVYNTKQAISLDDIVSKLVARYT